MTEPAEKFVLICAFQGLLRQLSTAITLMLTFYMLS